MMKSGKKFLVVFVALIVIMTSSTMLAFATDSATPQAASIVDDFSTVATAPKFESKTGDWIEHESVGYYRSSTDTQSLIYALDTTAPYYGISNIRAIVRVDGGLSAYEYTAAHGVKYSIFASPNKEKWFRVATSSATAVPADETYNKKEVNDVVIASNEAIESGMKYIKVSFEKVGANNNYSLGFKKIEINTYSQQPPVVEPTALSVVAGTANTMVAGGDGIEFFGVITPANATIRTISWEAFSDETCATASTIATFDENVLHADHDNTTAQTVYVRGSLSNGIKTAAYSVTVTPRPDPSAVSITEYTAQMNEGDTAGIVSIVSPINANNKTIVYSIFDDENCTIPSTKATVANGVISAVTKGKIYLQAKTVNELTDVKEINITKNVLLFSDDCTTLNYLYKDSDKNSLMVHNSDRIMRSVKTVNKEGFAAGPAYVSTDAAEKFDVYTPPELIYRVNNDITRFEIDVLINFPTADAKKNANNNPYRDYNWETFTSVNGTDWTYIDNDYTVNPPAESTGLTADAYAQLKLYNATAIPAGSKFIKIVILGPCTTIVYAEGSTTEIDRAKTAANFYQSTTAPLSQTIGFDKIWGFYNTWEPSVNGVKIFAAEGTTAIDGVSAVIVDDTQNIVYKGKDYSIKASTTTLLDPTLKNITDFSGFTVQFTAGSEYLQYANGKISLKSAFTGQIETAKFKLIKGDVESSEILLNLVLPVESLTITLDKNKIKIGEFSKISVTVNPENATIGLTTYHAKIATGKLSDFVTVQGDGKIKGKAPATVTVWAEMDGIKSNELTLTVIANTAITISNKDTMTVGDILNLTANITPDESMSLPITWEIVEGSDNATIDGDKLTAIKAGSVKIKATVDGKTSEMTITITDKVAEKKGCGSFGLVNGALPIVGALLVLATLGIMLVFIKKSAKKED